MSLTLQGLVQRCRELGEIANVEEVKALLESYISNPAEWNEFTSFNPARYTRTVLDKGNGLYNLMILCWEQGQESPIHDHANAHCFVKVLSGSLVETLFRDTSAQATQATEGDANTSTPSTTTTPAKGDAPATATATATSAPAPASTSTSASATATATANGEHTDVPLRNLVQIGSHTHHENEVTYINDTMGLHRMLNPSNVERTVTLHLYSPPFEECNTYTDDGALRPSGQMTFIDATGRIL